MSCCSRSLLCLALCVSSALCVLCCCCWLGCVLCGWFAAALLPVRVSKVFKAAAEDDAASASSLAGAAVGAVAGRGAQWFEAGRPAAAEQQTAPHDDEVTTQTQTSSTASTLRTATPPISYGQ